MDTMDTPGPDFVRVLAVIKREKDQQRWLVDLATNLLASGDWDIAIDDPALPSEFVLDKSFYAVPLGPWSPDTIDFETNRIELDLEDSKSLQKGLEVFLPEESTYFVIRGFVRANGPASIPIQIVGKPGESDLKIYSDPSTGTSLTCANDLPVGSVRDAQAELDVAYLTAHGFDGSGVAVAMVDSGIFLQHLTGINFLTGNPEKRRPVPKFPLPAVPVLDFGNSWKPATVATPTGAHRIGHGTMCAYNVLSVAPQATLLDYPSLIARAPGDHSVKGTVGAATDAFYILLSFWINNILSGAPRYRALVINNSWSIFHPCEEEFLPGHPGRYIDNLRHPFHLLVWILSQLRVDIVFAAGNGGLPCPTPPFLHVSAGSIRGAAAYPDVLTVAGCDVNDLRVGYSSQGPAVLMYPGPTPDKPDLTAYTHYLGSQVFGEREPDGGTSTACPIAAGCVAALRTRTIPYLPPAQLFDALRSAARAGTGGGPGGVWNNQYGYGIIDPVAASQNLRQHHKLIP
jgi:subtilisin family serine protease